MNHNPVNPASAPALAQVSCVLALELQADAIGDLQPALGQQAAGELATLLAQDLAKLAPQSRSLDLVLAAAHFDPAEALRSGWPLHRRLRELQQRAPRADDGGARIIAFGADAEGRVPQPLQDDPDLRGGLLRVLPFVLIGAAEIVEHVAATLEEVLLDQGMAGADTALAAQAGFGARIEHARCLTIHDLAAMTAMQYRHQGLEPLWPILETALLAPQATAELDAPPEPLVRYADGSAHITLFSPAAWRNRHVPRGDGDAAKIERIHQLFEARQRQFAAVLRAHGIEVVFDFESGNGQAVAQA